MNGKSHKEWLLAVPLYHFLKGLSVPYQKPVMDPKKISFYQERDIDLNSLKQKTYDAEEGYVYVAFLKCM